MASIKPDDIFATKEVSRLEAQGCRVNAPRYDGVNDVRDDTDNSGIKQLHERHRRL